MAKRFFHASKKSGFEKDPHSPFPTISADGIPWDIQTRPSRVVAVGDIHGDLESLCHILLERALVDIEGKWIGQDAHLVLVGDLVGGHKNSRLLLNFVMRLELEAEKSGGAVHALIGNHDILPLQRELKKMSRAEKSLYKDYPVPGAAGPKTHHAFRGDSVYAKWIRKRNALLRIGDTLFAHAGVDEWALHAPPDRVNSAIRAWIRFWQGVGEKPPKATRWTAGTPGMERGSKLEQGPLWLRAFKVKGKGNKRPKKGLTREELDQILQNLSVRRVVVGHAPVQEGEILTSHPYYDDRIVMIDTRLSDEKKGSLSALEIRDGELSTHYADSSKWGRELVKQEMASLKNPVTHRLPRVAELLDSINDSIVGLVDSLKDMFD